MRTPSKLKVSTAGVTNDALAGGVGFGEDCVIERGSGD